MEKLREKLRKEQEEEMTKALKEQQERHAKEIKVCTCLFLSVDMWQEGSCVWLLHGTFTFGGMCLHTHSHE
jgi:hypothetical protein